MSITLTKEKICVEDMLYSLDGTIEQDRGFLTPINATHIPYIINFSVGQALDVRPTLDLVDTTYAKVNGNTLEIFNCADGLSPLNVLNKAQIEDLLSYKADKNNVLQLNNTLMYTPTIGTHPATKSYVDTSTANAFEDALDAGSFLTFEGKVVTVINGLITGIA